MHKYLVLASLALASSLSFAQEGVPSTETPPKSVPAKEVSPKCLKISSDYKTAADAYAAKLKAMEDAKAKLDVSTENYNKCIADKQQNCDAMKADMDASKKAFDAAHSDALKLFKSSSRKVKKMARQEKRAKCDPAVVVPFTSPYPAK
jgi:hypothetical protein